MVAAGSVVSCGSVQSDADACGVAIRVAIRVAHIGAPLPHDVPPLLSQQGIPHAAAHDILEVVIPRHEVVLRHHFRRVAEPLGDDMLGITLHPVGRARRPKILQEPRPTPRDLRWTPIFGQSGALYKL
jgi:hypothetical protein